MTPLDLIRIPFATIGWIADVVKQSQAVRVAQGRDFDNAVKLAEREAEEDVAEPRCIVCLIPEVSSATGACDDCIETRWDKVYAAMNRTTRTRPSGTRPRTNPGFAESTWKSSGLSAYCRCGHWLHPGNICAACGCSDAQIPNGEPLVMGRDIIAGALHVPCPDCIMRGDDPAYCLTCMGRQVVVSEPTERAVDNTRSVKVVIGDGNKKPPNHFPDLPGAWGGNCDYCRTGKPHPVAQKIDGVWIPGWRLGSDAEHAEALRLNKYADPVGGTIPSTHLCALPRCSSVLGEIACTSDIAPGMFCSDRCRKVAEIQHCLNAEKPVPVPPFFAGAAASLADDDEAPPRGAVSSSGEPSSVREDKQRIGNPAAPHTGSSTAIPPVVDDSPAEALPPNVSAGLPITVSDIERAAAIVDDYAGLPYIPPSYAHELRALADRLAAITIDDLNL